MRQGANIIPLLQMRRLRPQQFQISLKVTRPVRRYNPPWAFPLYCTDVPRADASAMKAEERAINGHIVCVLSRTMTLGTHAFVCLLAVTQPSSAPLNVKGTMGSKSLSIHIFGIITKINFDLSSNRENKNTWVSSFFWPWFPQRWNEVGQFGYSSTDGTQYHVFMIMARLSQNASEHELFLGEKGLLFIVGTRLFNKMFVGCKL